MPDPKDFNEWEEKFQERAKPKRGRPHGDLEPGKYDAYYVRRDVSQFLKEHSKHLGISRSKTLTTIIRALPEFQEWAKAKAAANAEAN